MFFSAPFEIGVRSLCPRNSAGYEARTPEVPEDDPERTIESPMRGGAGRGVGLRHVGLRNRRRQVTVALDHPDVGVAEDVPDDEQRRPAHHEVARVGVPERARPERARCRRDERRHASRW